MLEIQKFIKKPKKLQVLDLTNKYPEFHSQLKKYGKIDGKIPILNIVKDRVFKDAKPQEYKSRLLNYIDSKKV